MKSTQWAAAMCLWSAASLTATAQTNYPAYSEWDCSYDTPQGYPVQARVALHGEAGSYRTPQEANGWLESVQWSQAQIGEPGVTLVAGTWRFQNGQTGWFKFHFNPSWTSFSGIWGFSGSKTAYAWNGRRASTVAAAPAVVQGPAGSGGSSTLAPSVSRPPVIRSGPVVVGPPSRPPAGSGRGGLPIISDPSRLPPGTQAKADSRTGVTTFFNKNGQAIGQSRRRN